MAFTFERVSPSSAGVKAESIQAFLNSAAAESIDLHSVMLLRHGKVCFEKWWAPHSPDEFHDMWSFSKSLTSTAVGFAVQEGSLSLTDRLVDLFPDKLPETVSNNLAKAAVQDLLTMSCGHETEPRDYEGDWIRSFLMTEFKYVPGVMFQYNTMGTNMLCAALRRRTGQNLTEYLRPRLLDPLGITETRMRFILPDGTEPGGSGYQLRTEDMARFMQFVANKGAWQGTQLLTSDWFDMATTKQIETENPVYPATGSDWLSGYGFQYWCCQPEGVFRADGMYGQFGIVMPRQDAVLIITEHTERTQDVLDLVWQHILPGFEA
jgi:CubicO group peptidase (beta-lactamase class C family)